MTTQVKTEVKTVVKHTAAKNIAKALRNQHTARRDLTISALFSALVNADISFMAGFTKADAAMFDTTLRSLLPVQFKQKQGGYVFDKLKADKIREEHGVEFSTTPWEEFAEKFLSIWLHGHQKAQEEEVDAQEQRQKAGKALERQFQRALDAGLSMHEMEVLFTRFKAKNGGAVSSNGALANVVMATKTEAHQAAVH